MLGPRKPIYTQETRAAMYQAAKPLEIAVAKLISERIHADRWDVSPVEGKFPYDIEIVKGEQIRTYEVKRQSYIDPKTGRTENIFVETANRWGKTTGIYASRADKWIEYIELDGELLITSPEKIRKFLEENMSFCRPVERAGEGCRGVLIPIRIFKEVIKPKVIKVPAGFGMN